MKDDPKPVNTAMWLVYLDSADIYHYQPWQDLEKAGTLIDPDNDEDMILVGWTTEKPQGA